MASLNPFDDSVEDDRLPTKRSANAHKKEVSVATRKGSRYEPAPRFGHSTALIGEKLFLWGGWQKGSPQVHTSQEKTLQCLKIDVMNLNKGEWSQLETYGEPPLGVRGYATEVIGYNLYYFGGYCGHDFCRHNTFKCLDTMTMEWKDIPSKNPNKSPMKKNACGMVSFKDGGQNYMFIYGGAGMLCSANEPEAIYIPWKENPNFGWTNESHIFELSTGNWITPTVKGDQPPPSAGFTLTQISPNTAIYIGGFDSISRECVKDVYKVEMNKDTISWTKLAINTPVDGRPRSRHDHSAACISDCTTEPCILIGGGRDVRWRSLDDVWVLNCESGQWIKLEVPEGVAHRHFHSLSMFSINSNIGYAIMFGGVKEWEEQTIADEQPMISDTTIIELTRSNEGVWSVSAFLDSAMLSATEEYKYRLIQRLFDTIQQDKGQTTNKTTNNARQDSVFEQTITHLQQQILSKDVQINSMETQIEHMTNRLDNTQNELSALQAKQNVQTPAQQATPSESPPIPKPRPPQSQSSSAISRAIAAEQLALECSEDILTPFQLSPRDITISGLPVHKGDYGHTAIAQYKGSKVFARVLQHPPVSAFHKMAFMRELLKAVRTVHPNIVLFLGAIVDSSVIIINELTISNVRYELEKKPFAKQDILDILNDIAKALSYLHQAKPRPIIHRAIFTENIFLEPMAFKWRAKLSDTILSNYYHFMDDGPKMMEPVYTPPEASNMKLHTPKYDIYSFGIVLLEIVARRQPPLSINDRDKLIQSVKWPPITEIINDCLTEEITIRPSADRILTALNKIQTK